MRGVVTGSEWCEWVNFKRRCYIEKFILTAGRGKLSGAAKQTHAKDKREGTEHHCFLACPGYLLKREMYTTPSTTKYIFARSRW